MEAVAAAADGLGWSPLEVALAWVRDRPGVTAPIVGARTAAQLKGILGVEELALPGGDRRGPRRRVGGLRMHTTSTLRPEGRRGVEWEFEKLTISREFSRNVVTRLLVERAEHGGWELDRVRVAADGTRRVVLRRKIIRQRATLRPPEQPGPRHRRVSRPRGW